MTTHARMRSPAPQESEPPAAASHFNTTEWSVVMLAAQSQDPQADAALERLCQTYWKPLFAYIRRQGHSLEDAQDLTQDFFARLLKKEYFALASSERGRFRSFLLKSLKHFLINDWVRGNARKRGGGQPIVLLSARTAEQADMAQASPHLTPETLYDKRWAMTLLERAMGQLRADYTTAGRGPLFEQLRPFLLDQGSAESYQSLGVPLGLTPGAVKVAVHRLRRRFGDVLRAEVARTVATPAEVDDELRYLMAALNR